MRLSVTGVEIDRHFKLWNGGMMFPDQGQGAAQRITREGVLAVEFDGAAREPHRVGLGFLGGVHESAEGLKITSFFGPRVGRGKTRIGLARQGE